MLPDIVGIKEIVERAGLSWSGDTYPEVIGRGESNLNMRLTADSGEQLNLRIGRRGDASQRSLAHECWAISQLPDAMKVRVHAKDLSGAVLGQPFILLDYVQGEVRERWSAAMLKQQSTCLALLHHRVYTSTDLASYEADGEIGDSSGGACRIDLREKFEQAVTYWQARIQGDGDFALARALLPVIREFVTQRNPLLLSLKHFHLVHGDLHKYNILSDRGRFRFIDWESAHIGDAALDLAKLVWPVATYWQEEISESGLLAYIHCYCEAKEITREGDIAALVERVDAWMVFTMYFDMIYHRTQIPGDASGRQRFTVESIERYLAQRFALSSSIMARNDE